MKELEQQSAETWLEFVTRVRAYQAKITDKRTVIVWHRDIEPSYATIEKL